MADFDAILRKALGSRPDATGEERRKIYERARQALIRQLTNFEPPLPPEDISRQRLALEAAIRKVEATVASNGGRLPGTEGDGTAEPDVAAAVPTASSAATSPQPVPAVSAAAELAERADSIPSPEEAFEPETDRQSAASGDANGASSVRVEPALVSEPVSPPTTDAEVSPPIVNDPAADPALVAEKAAANTSQGAAAEAPPISVSEPVAANDAAPNVADDDAVSSPAVAAAAVSAGAASAPPKKRGGLGWLSALVFIAVLGGGAFFAWQQGLLDQFLPSDAGGEPDLVATTPVEAETQESEVVSADDRSTERLLPDNQGTVAEAPGQPESEAQAEDAPVELAPQSEETAPTETAAAEDDVTQNVVAEDAGAQDVAEEATTDAAEVAAVPTQPGLPVAQSAILYEEGATAEAAGFTAPGRALWQLGESETGPVILGTVEVPNRGISINLRISRNQDEALPATHLLEFTFGLTDGFPADGIAELVGVVVKPEEQAGGDPLRGAIVDLGGGVFWQALANGEADQAVNLPLLRDGEWFDLPVLYADNRRAIISFEKGTDGNQIFRDALEAWSN
ncbi:MAG: hypothetical protein AAGH60_01835 [Pseudomonadota bacterium]